MLPYGATDDNNNNNKRGAAAAPAELQPLRPFPSTADPPTPSPSDDDRAPPRRVSFPTPASAASSSLCLQRLLLTYLLVLIIIAIAVLVDSVALIWAVIGSFGCISVGFLFPPMAYLKVGCRQQRLKRLGAWVILFLGSVLLVLCVTQTVFQLLGA